MSTTALEKFALLAELDPVERQAVAERLEWIRLEPGLALFREGDEADALWLVLEGEVELTSAKHGAAGVCAAGASLGTLSLVTGGLREVTAETHTDCQLLRLSREAFRNLRETAPLAACRLLEQVVREAAASSRAALSALEERAPRV
jgi:CRP-like cAMP-binding protein